MNVVTTTQPTWSERAIAALVEAQTMYESIDALASLMICGGRLGADDAPLLQAIVACAQRLNAAVKPVVEDAP